VKERLPRLVLIFCLLTTSLFIGGAARANDGYLPDPGLTPDSPFYFIDILGKYINMFFTFGADIKARKALEFAEERLAEARVMATQNRVREMERTTESYDKYMNMCAERLAEVSHPDTSEITSERIAIAAARHLEILDSIIDEAPEASAAALRRARIASQNGQVNALLVLGEVKPERAIDIARGTIDNQLDRVKSRIGATGTADVSETLEYAMRLAEIEDEITLKARDKYNDASVIDQSLSQADTGNREEIAGNIMPEISVPAIKGGLEDALGMYQSTIDQLLDRTTSNAAVGQTAVQRLQAQLNDSVGINTSNQQQTQIDITENTSAQSKTRLQTAVSNR